MLAFKVVLLRRLDPNASETRSWTVQHVHSLCVRLHIRRHREVARTQAMKVVRAYPRSRPGRGSKSGSTFTFFFFSFALSLFYTFTPTVRVCVCVCFAGSKEFSCYKG